MEKSHTWTEDPILDEAGAGQMSIEAIRSEVEEYAQRAYKMGKAAKTDEASGGNGEEARACVQVSVRRCVDVCVSEHVLAMRHDCECSCGGRGKAGMRAQTGTHRCPKLLPSSCPSAPPPTPHILLEQPAPRL